MNGARAGDGASTAWNFLVLVSRPAGVPPFAHSVPHSFTVPWSFPVSELSFRQHLLSTSVPSKVVAFSAPYTATATLTANTSSTTSRTFFIESSSLSSFVRILFSEIIRVTSDFCYEPTNDEASQRYLGHDSGCYT